MELNYDCLRETLIELENQLEITNDLEIKPIGIHEITSNKNLFSKFQDKDIAYCVYMLADSGLIKTLSESDFIREISVETLTYKGHEFLKQIENDTVWNKVKEVIKPIGAFTVGIISKVAENVITGIITQGLIG